MKRIKKMSFYLLLLITLMSIIGCKPDWWFHPVSQKLDRSVITTSR